MIYADPDFKRDFLQGFLLITAGVAASIIEGEQLVKNTPTFFKMTNGAHSIGVTTLLFLGFYEVVGSFKSKENNLKNRCVQVGAFICLVAGTLFHVLSLVRLHQKESPLNRGDQDLRNYLQFCRLFIFGNMVLELVLYNLTPAPPRRFNSIQLID